MVQSLVNTFSVSRCRKEIILRRRVNSAVRSDSSTHSNFSYGLPRTRYIIISLVIPTFSKINLCRYQLKDDPVAQYSLFVEPALPLVYFRLRCMDNLPMPRSVSLRNVFTTAISPLGPERHPLRFSLVSCFGREARINSPSSPSGLWPSSLSSLLKFNSVSLWKHSAIIIMLFSLRLL